MHTLRARLTAGLLNKAKRGGELALALPAGLVRDPLDRVFKHPDREVQGRLTLVFDTFLRAPLRLPGRPRLQRPRPAAAPPRPLRRRGLAEADRARRPLHPQEPRLRGRAAYGRSRAVPQKAAPHQRRTQKVLPLEEWKVCIRDKYPAYISWETFVTIQGMILDNHSEYDRNKTRGVPRPGKALLHGLVYCGECGHKMVVQYKKGTRYICNYLRQQYQVPVCQYLPADPIDAYVVGVFFDALAPAELDLYARAVAALQQEDEHMRRARQQQIERLRYQARLAERQFNQADPDNRLVTAELERQLGRRPCGNSSRPRRRSSREQQQPPAPEAA